MNRYVYIIILSIYLFSLNCGQKKDTPSPDIKEKIKENISLENDPYDNVSGDQFYKLEESLDDIQKQIDQLKTRISEYEYNPSEINYTEELKELIDQSPPSHKIVLKNGTVIQGTLIKDLINSIMVVTDVGRLNIEKKDIELIEDFVLPVPNIVFLGHGQKQIFDNYYTFKGKIINQGHRRGDFVRVIYNLWAENTQIISSDSVFIAGKEIMYESGIITDTCLEPNQSAHYNVRVNIDSEIPVSYITREVRWMLYE